MFLSKLVLNVRSREVRRDLGGAYEMHRTLWRAFPEGDPGRVLFRVDADRAGAPPVVLVQSDFRPRWERLDEAGPGYLAAPAEYKPFAPSFVVGRRLRFRLRANPTRKIGSLSKADRLADAGPRDDASKNGRRLALLREEDQVAWLLRKAEAGGFQFSRRCVEPDGRRAPAFRVVAIPEGWVRCGKDGHGAGRFFAVRFEGVLVVTDPAAFLRTVADGLGAAKGFGFGLLSVAPCRE